MGQPTNPRYRAVWSFARKHSLTFVIPESVYDELTAHEEGLRTPPIDMAIEENFVEIADSLDYTISLVSITMDGVRRYIANADDRHEDEIERADTALAGVIAQALDTNQAPGGHTSIPRTSLQEKASRRFLGATDSKKKSRS